MLRSVVATLAALVVGCAPFACATSQPQASSFPEPLGPAPAWSRAASSPAGSSPEGDELASTALVDSGLQPLPPGKQLPEGGSLRPDDASLVPEAAGLPDAITPPMVRDASIPEVHPVPLTAWEPAGG